MARRSESRGNDRAPAAGAAGTGARRTRWLRAAGAALLVAGVAGAGALAWRANRVAAERAAYASAPACDERHTTLADSGACRLSLRAEVSEVDCLRAGTTGGVCEVTVRVPTLDEDLVRAMPLRREYASLLRTRVDARVELFRGELVRVEAAGAMVPREEPARDAPTGAARWAACVLAACAGTWLWLRARN